jgi:predicted O-linked N-acetylglucosamine transferase (SPINDLY family)
MFVASPARKASALHAQAEKHWAQGNVRAAVALLEQAVGLRPHEAGYWHALGAAYLELEMLDEAERCCRRTIELDARHAKALANLGAVLQRKGAYEEAVQRYRDAVEADPELGQAWFNLGTLLLNQGRHAEAVEPLQTAVALDGGRAQWHTALGSAYDRSGRPLDAVASLQSALQLDPELAMAHEGLAICRVNIGDVESAIPSFRRALELNPDGHTAYSNMLFALNYRLGEHREVVFREHLAWGERYGSGLERKRHANQADAARVLRVGYVSPDFRSHAVAHFVKPLLEHHDRSRFHVVCYSDVELEDPVTGQLRALAQNWRRTTWHKNEELAKQILDDGIDILVDLAGHTSGGQRMLLFAAKPAPVQVSWLGYPNTTGLAAVDYRFTDAIADPDGETDCFHTEELVRLPQGFLCYGTPSDSPGVDELPLLEAGHVTFGCFNNLSKLTPAVLALWAQLLARVPGARLALKSFGLAGENVRQALRERFAAHGVAPERLQILGPEPLFTGHLARYGAVDVALDTFPYNGTTTTCEALWMGVPVVSLAGKTHVSRVGSSILHRVGFGELVARSSEEYIETAARLAADAGRLRELRAGMRTRMQASPLLDAPGFAGHVEAAYRMMWRRWCDAQRSAASRPPE